MYDLAHFGFIFSPLSAEYQIPRDREKLSLSGRQLQTAGDSTNCSQNNGRKMLMPVVNIDWKTLPCHISCQVYSIKRTSGEKTASFCSCLAGRNNYFLSESPAFGNELKWLYEWGLSKLIWIYRKHLNQPNKLCNPKTSLWINVFYLHGLPSLSSHTIIVALHRRPIHAA